MPAPDSTRSIGALAAPLYNLAALGRLAHNAAFVREFKTLFVLEVPQSLADLRASIAAHDLPAVAREAHHLKAMAGTLGLPQAVHLLRHIEQTASSGRGPGHLLASLQTLQLMLAPVLQALEQELPEGSY